VAITGITLCGIFVVNGQCEECQHGVVNSVGVTFHWISNLSAAKTDAIPWQNARHRVAVAGDLQGWRERHPPPLAWMAWFPAVSSVENPSIS